MLTPDIFCIHHFLESSGPPLPKIDSKQASSESAIGALIMSNNKLLGGEETLVYSGNSSTPVMTRKKKSRSNTRNTDSFSGFDGEN